MSLFLLFEGYTPPYQIQKIIHISKVGDKVVFGLTTLEYSHYSSKFQLLPHFTELEPTSSVFTISSNGGLKPKDYFRMEDG
jgi:hypothetical protein